MKSLTQFILEGKEADVIYDIFRVITCSTDDGDVDNNEDYIGHFIDHLREWVKKYDVKKVSYVVDKEAASYAGFEKSDFKGLVKGKIKFVMTDDIEEAVDQAFNGGADVDKQDVSSGVTVEYNDKFFYLEDSGDGYSVLVKKM